LGAHVGQQALYFGSLLGVLPLQFARRGGPLADARIPDGRDDTAATAMRKAEASRSI
jgi:hypothetical protein